MSAIVAVTWFPDGTIVLPTQLHSLVDRNREWLRQDFPGVQARYGTQRAADSSVQDWAERMQEDTRSGAAAVQVLGRMVGMVSYEFMTAPVVGPLIAGWMDKERTGPEKGVGLELLRAGGKALASRASSLSGMAWTLVWPDHPVVPRLLSDVTNGFGGFYTVREPKVYDLPGVSRRPMQLWVANLTIKQMAWALGLGK